MTKWLQSGFLPIAALLLATFGVSACDTGHKEADRGEVSATTKANDATAKKSATSTPSGPPRPAMWKLSDSDTHIFLFGGVHMLPKGIDWQSGWIDTVVDSADMLILELAPEEQAQAPQVLAELTVEGSEVPMDERIPPQLTDELDILAGRARVSRAQLDGMESWAAALTLSNAVSRNASLSIKNGTEAILTKRFQDLGKPVSGLETAQFQLSLFDQLPQRTQDELLTRTIEQAGDASTKFDQLISAWSKGDVGAVARYADAELRDVEGLSLPLLEQRNAAWAKWINDRMQQPGTVLIAVGAGHLVGDDSVQTMLQEMGYKVERVQ